MRRWPAVEVVETRSLNHFQRRNKVEPIGPLAPTLADAHVDKPLAQEKQTTENDQHLSIIISLAYLCSQAYAPLAVYVTIRVSCEVRADMNNMCVDFRYRFPPSIS